MQSIEWIIRYEFVRHALLTGIAVGSVCSLMSVIVVLKRMAFIGQGISHAGFGAIGVGILLGLSDASREVLLVAWCIASALLIGWMTRGRRLEADSAIGILLVAAMALGVLADDLAQALRAYDWYEAWVGPARSRRSFESILFGSLSSGTPTSTGLALGLGLAVLACGAAFWKEILFFTFDESSSRVFGVPTRMIHRLLLILLAITIVVSIRLAGVVLVTALLVLPGATALQLSRRLGRVLLLSWATGLVGTVGGLLIAIELGAFSSGPCIVALLLALLGVAAGASRLQGRRPGGAST